MPQTRQKEKLIVDRFLRMQGPVEQIVGGVRYADDLLLMSGVLCPDCLLDFGH